MPAWQKPPRQILASPEIFGGFGQSVTISLLFIVSCYFFHPTGEYDVGASRVLRVELIGVAVLPLGQRHAHRRPVVFLSLTKGFFSLPKAIIISKLYKTWLTIVVVISILCGTGTLLPEGRARTSPGRRGRSRERRRRWRSSRRHWRWTRSRTGSSRSRGGSRWSPQRPSLEKHYALGNNSATNAIQPNVSLSCLHKAPNQSSIPISLLPYEAPKLHSFIHSFIV